MIDRPYGEDSSIALLYDIVPLRQGESVVPEPQIKCISVAGGLAAIDTAPQDQEALTRQESTALALTCIGMSQGRVHEELDLWHFCSRANFALGTMYEKLNASGRLAGEVAVATALERGYVWAEQAPKLDLHPYYRQQFLELGIALATGPNRAVMAKGLGLQPKGVPPHVAMIAAKLELGEAEKPEQTLILLNHLSRAFDAPNTIERLQSVRGVGYEPFKDNSDILLVGKTPNNSAELDLGVDEIGEIVIKGGIIEINNDFVDSRDQRTRLRPRVLSTFILKSLGLDESEIAKHIGINERAVHSATHELYQKLLPPAPTSRGYSLAPAILSAFQKNLLNVVTPPELDISSEWRTILNGMVQPYAENIPSKSLEEQFAWGTRGFNYRLGKLAKLLNVPRAAAMLIALAQPSAGPLRNPNLELLEVLQNEASR